MPEGGEHPGPVKLDYASKENSLARWQGFVESAGYAFLSLLILGFGLFALGNRLFSSSIFGDDPFFALAFSVICGALAFPLFIVIGFGGRRLAEKRLKRRFRQRGLVPWMAPVLGGLACFIAALCQSQSPASLFPDRLGAAPPASLSNFQYWSAIGPGDSMYAFSFKIDPAEFSKLLAVRAFAKDSNPRDIGQHLNFDLPPGWDCSIGIPAAPLTTLYKYSTENPPGLPHIVDIYTTARRDEVLICGDN